MIDTGSYLLFLAASLALIAAPGPAQALVISKTVAGGMRGGVLTGIGLNLGTLLHAAAAALGLSAVLATSATAFAVVKYVGAAYLVWLGIRALRTPPAGPTLPSVASSSSSRSIVGEALVVGVLNPKVAIFFLAFLPQFVDPVRGNVFAQFMLLGLTMALLDTLYEIAIAWGTHRLRDAMFSRPSLRLWQERVSGVVMIALGLRLAVQQR